MDVVCPGARDISVVAWILDSKVLADSRTGVPIFLLSVSFSGHCDPVSQCVSSGLDIGCTYSSALSIRVFSCQGFLCIGAGRWTLDVGYGRSEALVSEYLGSCIDVARAVVYCDREGFPCAL